MLASFELVGELAGELTGELAGELVDCNGVRDEVDDVGDWFSA